MKTIHDINPATDEQIQGIMLSITDDASPDCGAFNNGEMLAVLKRLQDAEAELKQWREDGVTEELLRKQNGAIKV